jgi:hypothetical protein
LDRQKTLGRVFPPPEPFRLQPTIRSCRLSLGWLAVVPSRLAAVRLLDRWLIRLYNQLPTMSKRKVRVPASRPHFHLYFSLNPRAGSLISTLPRIRFAYSPQADESGVEQVKQPKTAFFIFMDGFRCVVAVG